MESPVRICICAAIVVNLLLLCSTADGGTIPETTVVKDERVKINKTNTWIGRNPPKTPDVSLNELNPKESTSEEHTEKNAKYKDRGRVRFISTTKEKATTRSPFRRIRSTTSTSTTSTEAATLIIVTPTPEVKKPSEIIDGMRTYKSKISSTTPLSVKSEEKSVEEYEDKEDEEENNSFEKYTSNKYFTIPNFDDDDFNHDSENESSNNKVKQDYSSPSHSFSSYFPKEYSFKEDSEPFKSSFFDFDSELTTPRNDFFDKKFQEISSSIIKNLDTIKAKSPPPNMTNVHTIVEENIGLERLNNNTPSNKSSVFLKNTKEIRLSDNQGASSANKELSDVQGTSIYYEMSVLSTETYAINHSDDDDCDDSPTAETTVSTSSQEELRSIKAHTSKEKSEKDKEPTRPTKLETNSEILTTMSSNFLGVPSIHPMFDSDKTVAVSTLSYPSTTERVTRIFSSSYTRNRNYSKRLNLTGTKDSPNSVTFRTDGISNTARPQTRKFHHTTPKNKPIWMAPRRNITRGYPKPTSPTTIYSEHFDIKHKFTPNARKPGKTVLTTISSAEIDPVLQSDIGGTKKVVQSQSISDNTIPSLRKRGSTRFTTSTASSAEKEAELVDLEMPSTAWALAGLISPPSLPTAVVNATENELQKVGEVIDKKETTIATTTTTTASPINNDIITKKVTEVNQNKLLWQPANSPASSSLETSSNLKSENQPAESSIPTSSSETATEATLDNVVDSKPKVVKPLWIPATDMDVTKSQEKEAIIPPVDATKSTGFESITKLPADVTTPQDEAVASSNVNQTVTVEKPKTTTDYDITTIRFSYVPTEPTESTDTNDVEIVTTWHPSMPTRTKQTTIEDKPITTYRPKYITTTDVVETTTTVPETTPVLEVSSQIIANATEKLLTTETIQTTEEITTQPSIETTEAPTTTTMTTTTTVTVPTTTIITESTTIQTTELPEDTTTIVVEVVTEINTEKVTVVTPKTTTIRTTTTDLSSTETDCTSEENSNSNEIDPEIKTTMEPETSTEETTEKPMTTVPITNTTLTHETIKTTEPPTAAVTTEVPTTEPSEELIETTTESEGITKVVNDLEDLTSYAGEVTTEASSRVLPDEAGSGAAVAIAVSTIGVIALILLIGLLLIVRRRGRRGIYAQRCTPVSLDAYSLDSVSVGHRKGNQRLRASKRSYGNPAYDDEVTSHPMQYPALANFALDVDSITAEFSEIPSVTVRPEEVPAGSEDKNRYSNVLPLPETRVPLRRIGNDPTSEYINANYVSGPGNIRNYYILAQAPLSNTVIDFWRMVWEQNSRLIVMLTEYMENGVEKCYEYLPPSEITDNKRTFGEYKIILKKREQRDKYAISTVQMYNLTTRTWREITHLWYFWPAKGVPDDYDSVIDFLFEMRSYMKVAQTAKEFDEEGIEVIYGDQTRSSFNNLSKLREDNGSGNGVNVYSPARAEEQMRRGYGNNGTLSRMKAASEVEGIRPCIMTCASGAGRSAAVAALDICSRALHAGGVDVPRVTRLLRTQRPHSLANRHHYTFLYKVLSEYGNKVMGSGDTI